MEAFPFHEVMAIFQFFHVYQLNLLLNKLSIMAKIANFAFSIVTERTTVGEA